MAGLFEFVGFGTFSGRVKNPFTFYLFALVFTFLFGGNLFAQDELPENAAPPPLRIISKDERTALARVNDIKSRTKLAIDLMEARLKKAEALNTEESFGAMLNELGSFDALMRDALNFLNRNDDGRGKTMDTYKRFEMALRAFTPRIELLRREMPESFEFHVRKVLINVRDTRSKAVEPLFGSTVVSEGN